MALLPRIAAAAVLAAALAACGHARHAPLARSPHEDALDGTSGTSSAIAISNSGEPMWPPHAAPSWSAPASGGNAVERPAVATEARDAAARRADEAAPEAHAAPPAPEPPPVAAEAAETDSSDAYAAASAPSRGSDGAGRGALKGLGWVLYVTGYACISGGPITLILCAAAISQFWPAYLAIVAGGMAIGAAAGAASAGGSHATPAPPSPEADVPEAALAAEAPPLTGSE